MNNVVLCGRFTRDPELRYGKGAEPMAVLSGSLAVNRKFKKDEADFINIKAFGKTAENISKFFGKGRLILIRGHIQTGSYDNKQGQKVYTTDVIIDDFDFTGEKKQENGAPPDQQPDNFAAYGNDIPLDEGDLPF